MAKKVIKINTNPNKTPATKYPNPTAAMIGRQDYYENVVAPDAPPRVKKETLKFPVIQQLAHQVKPV
jgi:hypothetical protein